MFTERNNKLRATFKFTDFKQAFAFMTEVALHAESQNHHPEWSNVYNTVKVVLCTHDAENTITKKDRKLAKTIDHVYEKYSA